MPVDLVIVKSLDFFLYEDLALREYCLRILILPDHVYHVEVKTINTIGGFSSLSE